MTPNEFIEQNNITIDATLVPFSESRSANDEHLSLNWKVTLKVNDRLVIMTDYMQGIGHLPDDLYTPRFENGRVDQYERKSYIRDAVEEGRYQTSKYGKGKPLPPPDTADVLYCLIMDSEVLNYACFEVWANEFGYDTDSRKAEALYQQCLNIALAIRAAGIDLDEAGDVFADY